MEVLDFVGAKVVVYDVPDEFIRVHFREEKERRRRSAPKKIFQESGVIVLPKTIDQHR